MDMFLKMLSLLVFILIGYLAKRLGIVREQAISTLSIIILDFTLPCTIIRNFNGVFPDPHVFTLLLLGFLLNFLCLGLGWLTGGRDRDSRGFSMINISGYNIGMFAMAFIQSFFPPSIFIPVCLCDVGNAIMTMGGNYAVAARACHAPGMNAGKMAGIVLRCVGFHCYIVLIVLAVLHISLPDWAIAAVSPAAFINPFLCMFMIGIGLRFSMSKSSLRIVSRILVVRYASHFLLCGAVLLLPLDRKITAALILFLLSPVSGLCPIYTMRLVPRMLEDSAINICVSILISIGLFLVLIPALLHYAL